MQDVESVVLVYTLGINPEIFRHHAVYYVRQETVLQ